MACKWPVSNEEDKDKNEGYDEDSSTKRKTHIDNCNTVTYIQTYDVNNGVMYGRRNLLYAEW